MEAAPSTHTGRAKRNAEGTWVDSHGQPVDPDATVMNSTMGPDAFSVFVQFNGALDFQRIEDLSDAWRTLSDAEVLSARVYVPGRESDAVFPLQYVASLTGRAIAVANQRPTAPSFKPARKPRYYDVRAALKLKKFDRRVLDAPPRMAMRLGERAATLEIGELNGSDFSDIEDSDEDERRSSLAPQPFDEDAMFAAAAVALDAAEAAERERAAAAVPPSRPLGSGARNSSNLSSLVTRSDLPPVPAPPPVTTQSPGGGARSSVSSGGGARSSVTPSSLESLAPVPAPRVAAAPAPAPTRERDPPPQPVSQAAPPLQKRKRKKDILDTSSDEDEAPRAKAPPEIVDLTAD